MMNPARILIAFAIVATCIVLSDYLSIQGLGQTVPGTTVATAGNQMDAETLEHEVRITLPAGSSLRAVQEFLSKRALEFSFEPKSQTVLAIARNLKGSTNLASRSLAFRFHFDEGLILTSIDTERVYTGP